MKAIGITCGIGSMLQGAKAAGFDVIGNIEWRKYYHKRDTEGRNTFRENYPGAFLSLSIDDVDVEALRGTIDLAMGHPECGKYSQMNVYNKGYAEGLKDPGDIPLFCEMVDALQPRFFVMDDLPKSLGAFTMEDYARMMPGYDLYPEWISNYHYGNCQKNRRRLFMIGALKSEEFVFRPGEFMHDIAIKDVIGDLLDTAGDGMNGHNVHVLDENCGKGKSCLELDRKETWRTVQKQFLDGIREGDRLFYWAKDGARKPRIGFGTGYWNAHSHVLDGGSAALHPIHKIPLTVRERARIQGFADDFLFYGIKTDEEGKWNIEKNSDLVKQTGKAMPIQFCTYAAFLVATHLGKAFMPKEMITGKRCAKDNPEIDAAKFWFCDNIGYADQEGACQACWLRTQCKKLHDQIDLPETEVEDATV